MEPIGGSGAAMTSHEVTNNTPATSRYVRQMRYAPIGTAGQQSLGSRSAVVVGLGALGAVIASHLVRAGIGRIRLIDRDIVEYSNLHRQMLYTEEDAEHLVPKAEAAAIHLRAANSEPIIEPVVTELSAFNAERLLADADIIMDGTDNFSARYLINEVSVKHGIPWVYGGAVGGSGMCTSIIPGTTACFRCLFPAPPAAGAVDTCETAGVISPIVDIIGSLQAAEALKLLTGNAGAVNTGLTQVDVWHSQWLNIKTTQSRRSDCPVCAKRSFETLENTDSHTAAASLCGRHTVQITPPQPLQSPLSQIASRLSHIGQIESTRYLMRISLADRECTFILFPDGRALIQGTDDPVAAQRIYNDLIGT
ncbi:ThiF family adenylyltransferase [Paenibacillus sp. PR3]|uniref:ThiF family adenylyltransferase n=2 Tax=Paenibacillus terricola TaxID=2763503 RepID=A0ABR8MNT3_9BACL|nr:ThiF family adenylyltransferase [Paenibacillus terricola]